MRRSPSVLFIDQSPQLGGAELMLADLVKSLPGKHRVIIFGGGPFPELLCQQGTDVGIVPLGSGASGIEKKSTIMSAARALPDLWRCAREVAQHASGFDLIYANTQKALVVGRLAATFSRKPIVFHLHDLVTSGHFSTLNRKICISLANRAVLVICNSKATERAFVAGGGRNKKCRLVYNGIDPMKEMTDYAIGRVRKKLGVSPNEFLVGVFGRLTPWKGQHVLLEALEKLATSNPTGRQPSGVRAIVVGEALFTDEDRCYAERLRREADSKPLRGRVQFLGHREDVPALMRACDVIVHTSVQPEPFGRVVVEGMLAGKPVIATDAGGVPEIITHDIDGLLVPPGDSHALAGNLERLLHRPQLRYCLAVAGRETAEQRFSVQQMVKGVGDIVDHTAQPSAASR